MGVFKYHIQCIKVQIQLDGIARVICMSVAGATLGDFCLTDKMNVKEDKRFMQITFRCEQALKKNAAQANHTLISG